MHTVSNDIICRNCVFCGNPTRQRRDGDPVCYRCNADLIQGKTLTYWIGNGVK